MANSFQARIVKLEQERKDIEQELKNINENMAYFESSQLKYDAQISALEKKPIKNDKDLKQELFLKTTRKDLIGRIFNLSALRLKKITRIDEINAELMRLY